MLGIVSCHYNPCGYRKPVENWHRWRQHVAKTGRPVVSVELSFNGQFDTNSEVKLIGTEDNILFQKEALMNVAMSRLPAECDAVAWIDADAIFSSDDWADKTEQKLKTFPLVQMWKTLDILDPDGQVEATFPSAVSLGEYQGHTSKPGLAWAARREIMDGIGLYTNCIVGSGDVAVLNAAQGRWESDWSHKYVTVCYADWLLWAGKYYRRVRGNIAYVDNHASHLWHGTFSNRQYVQRHTILKKADCVLSRDVKLNADGVLEFTGANPRLKAAMIDYFLGRKEDQFSE